MIENNIDFIRHFRLFCSYINFTYVVNVFFLIFKYLKIVVILKFTFSTLVLYFIIGGKKILINIARFPERI